MKFDTVIIGGGLSGLICGIKLQQNQQRCVIISSGHSSLHFSSGSFDLYSKDLEGNDIENHMLEKIAELIEKKSDHPYAKIGLNRLNLLMDETKKMFSAANILIYDEGENNHYRISPMGKLVPTWLTQKGHAVSSEKKTLPWKKVVLFSIDGFLDHFPTFVADEFCDLGVTVIHAKIELPVFDILRTNPAGLIATSIARELDKKENREELIKIVKENAKDCDALVLPACVSMDCDNIVELLEKETERRVVLIPTLPPSVAGSSMQKKMVSYFKSLGGVYMLGDTVNKVDIVSNKVERVYSANHGNIPFSANNFVLATGGFFSKGIVSSNVDIKEPLFNLDIDYDKDRFAWYAKDVFHTQEYQSYGVKSTKDFKGQIGGIDINNLYVIGAILNGHNPIKEGSGGGVSILSSLYVADQVLKGCDDE